MTLFFCLDDRNGLSFNNRRQSRDRAVLADMASQLTGVLLVDPMSEKMMIRHDIPYEILTEETLPAEDAQYFVEQRPLDGLLPLAKKVVIYRWNQIYPADRHLEIPLQEAGFSLSEVAQFPGYSHETITREVYVR